MEGANTEHSGSYPDGFAKLVLCAITSSVEEVEAMSSQQRWPCIVGCPLQPVTAGDACSDSQVEPTSAGSGTDAARRCPKTASFSRLAGGAVQQQGVVDPSSAVPSGNIECEVVHNARTISCARGRPQPTFHGIRPRAYRQKQTEPTPIEGTLSQECFGSNPFGESQLARTPIEPTGSRGNQVRGGMLRCITPPQTCVLSDCDSSST